ncbi:zinc finger MYM-type protein 1-like [Camellia sinensis]|uniref:zinc finger MYM-type protein 1-like n=1 Tax=Camellia sinensis TaxID=4442 RepID=UPI001036E400|nr:zinc finger MYM-type protein 1-like [Camellia sinensis]
MNALSLKQAMENLFSRLGLSISRLRGQGYDGASNMQGEFNGLKTLILKENPCAYYVHCFAHQLQLALVAVAKNNNQIALLFTLVSNVVNVVGASCKHRDIVREKQAAKVAEAHNNRELSSGQGLNQETNLKRAGDTRWGSHYGTLASLASMFLIVIDVLEMISEDGSNSE